MEYMRQDLCYPTDDMRGGGGGPHRNVEGKPLWIVTLRLIRHRGRRASELVRIAV